MNQDVKDLTILQLASELGANLERLGWRLASAESCTGGGIAAAVTEVAGSSSWFEYGFVTYANSAKIALLSVDPATLAAEGAVSEAVVRQMVEGALSVSGADLAVSVSGIAGPGGGSHDKPVGTVWLAWGSLKGGLEAHCYYFTGDRAQIRRQAVVVALRELVRVTRADNTPA